jgi:trans-aconitate 2-methyltransferase
MPGIILNTPTLYSDPAQGYAPSFMPWDPDQYEKFRDERSRPFFDLVGRVPDRPFRRIVDLGSGTGELSRMLLDRWPEARVTGVDRSPEMLAAARPRSVAGRLDFVLGDIAVWEPGGPVGLIVSNATLQWVPDHARLLPRLLSWLDPGGILAVQVPANHDSPSHTLILKLAEEPPWRERLRGRWRPHTVEPLAGYVEILLRGGAQVDAWGTTYLHVLPGADPVLEWLKGSALRPVLSALGEDGPGFLEALGPRLRDAYPPGPAGTLFPFRRLFFTARVP